MVQGEQGKHGRKIMAIGRPPSTSRTSMPGNIIFSLSLVSLWIFFSCLIYSAVMSLPAQAEDGAALVRGPCNVTAFVLCSLSLVFSHCDSFFIFKMRHCQSHRRRWCPPYILFASSSTDLQENAPGDYRFIDGGEVCIFAAVVLRRNTGKTLLCPSVSI